MKITIKKYFFITLFLLLPIFSEAQQEETEFFLQNISVTKITSDGENLWLATNGNGIFELNLKTQKIIEHSSHTEDLQIDFFHSIAVNKDFVWAGSTDGLFIYDKKNKNWSRRKFSLGGIYANWIRALAYDEINNVLWIGRFQYLTKFDLTTRKYTDFDLTIRNNEKTNNIKSLLIENNFLWIGTEAGLHRYDTSKNINDMGARIFFDTKNNSFNSEGEQASISSLLNEREYLWVGLDEFVTEDRPEFNVGGLFRFDKKNDWLLFNGTKGLTGNGVFSLARTGNYIWASLYQFGKQTKEYFGRGIVLINRITNQVFPIRDEKIPRLVYSIFFDGTNLWLGTEKGLIKINFFNKLAMWK
ncbi:MAG: hypothetical protein N2321_04235 [Melioribacteraceae bacterium]|nr:hypothetical protein [Melioribacteraceae bacterium]